MQIKYIFILAMLGGYSYAATNQINLKTKNDTIIKLRNVNAQGVTKLDAAIELKAKVEKQAIKQSQSSTLGDLLRHVSGVQDTYFGPNVGVPMIRSLSGNRVRLLNNGVAMNDLTAISPEFNLNYNPNNLEEVEVNKASASVLYGGKAIGGAVNMITQNQYKPVGKTFKATVGVEGASNSGTRQQVDFSGDFSPKWSWTVGGSHAKIERIRIPGNTKPVILFDPKVVDNNSALQALGQIFVDKTSVLNTTLFPYISQYVLDNLDDPSAGLTEEDKYTFTETYFDWETFTQKPNPKNPDYIPGQDPVKDRRIEKILGIHDYVPTKYGEITNSHSEQMDFNAGVKYMGKNLNFGLNFKHDYADYGLPLYAKEERAMHSHTHDHSHGHSHTHTPKEAPFLPVNIKGMTDNLSLDLELNKDFAIFNQLKFNALGQYTKDNEYLAQKVINSYKNQNYSGRMELKQKKFNFLSGVTGVDFNHRIMDGSYKLRYLPDNKSTEFGIFTLQKLKYKFIDLQIGYRHDWVHRSATTNDDYQRARGKSGGNLTTRDFNLNQFNSKILFNLKNKAYLLASYAHSERAPEVNELYAGNTHFALGIEENGEDMLDKEWVNAVELGGGISLAGLKIEASLYKNFYKNYIYMGHTGVSRVPGLTVKEWRAADTNIYGMELNTSYTQNFGKFGEWTINGFYDLVKNENVSDSRQRQFTDGDYMPNMPQSRWGAGLSAKINKFNATVNMQHYLQQKYLGKMIWDEEPMPAFTLLNARFSIEQNIGKTQLEYYLFGKNLLNQEARPQNTLMKYLAPLPGINIGAGVVLKI